MKKDILYPLRYLHGKIHKKYFKIRRKIEVRNYLRYPQGNKVYVLGSPVYTNLGDSAILLAQIDFLKRVGIDEKRIKEVSFNEYYQDREFIKKYISPQALICGLGGGNMGNQWYSEEKFRYDMFNDFPKNPIMIFPQTIYFTEDKAGKDAERESVFYYDKRKNLTLIAREKKSYELMRKLYPSTNIILTPDIVLSTTRDSFEVNRMERKGVLICARNDVEKEVSDETWAVIESKLDELNEMHSRIDMYSDIPVTKENRRVVVKSKIEEFASAKLVLTDRLHGMVFSAITETPCIVFSNYNYKVQGTYEWIKHLPYIRFVKNIKEAEECIPVLLNCTECKYDNSKMNLYFEKITEIIKRSI